MKVKLTLLVIALILLSCDKKDKGPLIVEIKVDTPTGYGMDDGNILLSIRGGMEPYRVSWTKDHPTQNQVISNEENLKNVSSGMYFLRVDEQLGSTYLDSVFLITNDTVKPLEYLPVYPGSYWIYTNGDTMRAQANYIKTAVFLRLRPPPIYDQGDGSEYYPYDSIFLPYWNDLPILEYYSVNHSSSYIPLIPILTDNIGSTIFITTDNRSSCSAFMTESLDTTLTVNNITYQDVIQTSRWSMYQGSCWDYPDKRHMVYHSKRFYAKDVGLIKEEIYKPNDPLIIKDLVEWHINNNN